MDSQASAGARPRTRGACAWRRAGHQSPRGRRRALETSGAAVRAARACWRGGGEGDLRRLLREALPVVGVVVVARALALACARAAGKRLPGGAARKGAHSATHAGAARARAGTRTHARWAGRALLWDAACDACDACDPRGISPFPRLSSPALATPCSCSLFAQGPST